MPQQKTYFTVVGGKHAEGNLRRMSFKVRYIAPAFETVGQRFRSQVEAQFALGGSLPGVSSPWRRLSPFTRNEKGSSRVLIDRSLLLQSYTDTRAVGNITEISASRARFGSAYKTKSNKGRMVPIVKFHQEGTTHMPARPVVLGNPFLDQEILDVFVDHIFSNWR